MNCIKDKNIMKHAVLKLFLALISVFALFIIIRGTAGADAIDYVDNNYTGTVTREDGADMYSEPGTAKPHITDADGNNIHVDYGTEVLILKEDYDPDLDMWYYCTVTVNDVEYTGYLYSGRVTRGEPIAHTPTPTPTLSPVTPTPEIASSGSIQSGDIYGDTAANEDTESMIDKADSFKPWVYIIILCIIIVLFMIGYTVYVRFSEEKLEREIERYSNRPQYEPLEGELDEDYEEAKSNYYDSIGLGAQANKDYNDLMANQEDMDLNMASIYADQISDSDEQTEDPSDSLSDLIASLEKKLGDAGDVYDEDYLETEAYDEEASDGAYQNESDYRESYYDDEADTQETVDFTEVDGGGSREYENDEAEEEADTFGENTYYEEAPETEGFEAEAVGGQQDEQAEAIEEAAATPAEEIIVPDFIRRSSKDLSAKASRRERVAKEDAPNNDDVQPAEPAETEQKAVSAAENPDLKVAKLSLRTRLDQLAPKALILHRVYGKGVVIDNTDPDIIQVKFGNDMRFLKKDKLVEKKLIKLQKQ